MLDVSEQTSPAIGSKEFFRRAKRFQSSPDSDTATAETIAVMVDQIRRSKNDPLMWQVAKDALNRWGNVAALGGPAAPNAAVIAWAVWWYAKHNLKFVHHEKQIWAWFGERDQLQLLIEPSVLVRMKQWEGDCAIYSMFVCTLLEILGVPWELVTLKCNPRNPNVYSHVFARAVLGGGQREALDASHGKFPGWHVPAAHTFQSQVWDESGNAIADQRSGFDGLHNYARPHRAWGAWGYRGMGDTCLEYDDSGNCIQTDSGAANIPPSMIDPTTGQILTPTIPTPTTWTCPSGQSMVSGVCTDPSTGGLVAPTGGTSSTAWAAFAAQLAKSGMTLAEINAIQPGTVVSPNGAILRQATGYPVSAAGTSLTATLGTLGSSSMIWVLLAVGAIVLIGGRR